MGDSESAAAVNLAGVEVRLCGDVREACRVQKSRAE